MTKYWVENFWLVVYAVSAVVFWLQYRERGKFALLFMVVLNLVGIVLNILQRFGFA